MVGYLRSLACHPCTNLTILEYIIAFVFSSPGAVIDVMTPQLDHKNGRMREDIVNFIIFALLTFPSDAFDFDSMIKMMGPLFLDPKRRVRQACLEAIAMMAQCMGPTRVKVLYDTIASMDTGQLMQFIQE